MIGRTSFAFLEILDKVMQDRSNKWYAFISTLKTNPFRLKINFSFVSAFKLANCDILLAFLRKFFYIAQGAFTSIISDLM